MLSTLLTLFLVASPSFVSPVQDDSRLASQDQEDAIEVPFFEGAVFRGRLAEGYVVTESGTGQLHFAEFRREGNMADLQFPALKLMCAPGAVANLSGQQFEDMLALDVQGYATATGMTLAPSETINLILGGTERTGLRFQLSSEDPNVAGLSIDLITFEHGENLIAAFAKSEAGDEANMRAMTDLFFATLEAKPVTMASAKLVQVANFTIEVPLVYTTNLNPASDMNLYQVKVGNGVVEFGGYAADSESMASTMGGNFLNLREGELRIALAGAGGTIVDTRWAGEWVQDGQLRGFHMDWLQSDGVQKTVSVFYVVAGKNFFLVTVSVATAEHAATLGRMRDMLESLQCADAPGELRRSFGLMSLVQAEGLTLFYPDTLMYRTAEKEVPRLILTGLWANRSSDFEMLFDIYPGELPGGDLDSLARSEALTRFPDSRLGQSVEIGGTLLGQGCEGVQFTVDFESKTYQVTAIVQNLHAGHLVAMSINRLENATSAGWTFANICAGLAQLEEGDRWITSRVYDVIFDPADWNVRSWHKQDGNEFDFLHKDSGVEVTVQDYSADLEAGTEITFEVLVNFADPFFELRKGYIGLNVTGDVFQDFEIFSEQLTRRDINGVTCLHQTVGVRIPDDGDYLLEMYYLLTPDRAVTAHYYARESDSDGLAAAEALVETLKVHGGIGIRQQTEVLGDLRFKLPVGYVSDMPGGDGFESIFYWNSLHKDSYLSVARIPSLVLPSLEALWEETDISIAEAVAPEFIAEISYETFDLSFLGEIYQARMYTYTSEGASEVSIQAKAFVQVRGWTYEITSFAVPELREDIQEFLQVLGEATLITDWNHVSDSGFNIEYNAQVLSLLRVEQPGSVTDGFSFSGPGGEALFHIDADGQWAFGDDELTADLVAVAETATRRADLPATTEFTFDAGPMKLKFTGSTNLTKEPTADGANFSNGAAEEGLYITVKYLEGSTGKLHGARYMNECILNDPIYSVGDFSLVIREVLGELTLGHKAAFTDEGGLYYGNQKFIVTLPGGVIELYVVWAPGGLNLGLTQVNLFFDSLELVK